LALTVQSVRLPNGVALQYVEQGDPAGIPVVFLHGVSDSWRSFEMVLPHLPASIRAIALTQRGHGDSDRPASGYQMRDFAADVAGVLDALGIQAAVIAGHSMGSIVAQRFALDYPARTLGLVLMGAFVSVADNPAVPEFYDQVVAPLTDPIDPAIAREFQESTLARPVPAELLDMVIGESLKVPARVWKAVFEGLLKFDQRAELGSIAAPALVVWGDQDIFSPRADQDELATVIPGGQLLVYAGHGHAMHWEDPRRSAADLAAYFHAVTSGAPLAAPAG
jgi:pimeloyl-ACP methyl ester carboxylesterase